ncbi:MAG: Dam family site-specific DNA-(adenine-N6)-methyltransferase, partial [Enterococcus sp.]|nr:Dam family site-specific DNA-(adenine-N6)-methyltransferase [Enterococcus sp.]
RFTKYNKKIEEQKQDIETAALFIFLNKHCFNGLYRVNSKGLFNVPFNGSIRPSFNPENIYAIHSFLQNVEISNLDFEEAVSSAKEEDFVFFDSPYAPLNPTSFESYTKEGFAIEDHERLAELFTSLSKQGVHCMLTNHNTELIRSLYKDFNIETVQVKRMINCKSAKRTGEEVIVRNYE